MTRPYINPALGIIDLKSARTLKDVDGTVAVVIPAHNEEDTVAKVVQDAFTALETLGVSGEVIVSASGCTDATAGKAAATGAQVVESPLGKGNAIVTGVKESTADVVCLIDGDLRYLGEQPLAVSLVTPILRGIADATIADLYWRPIYPQLWLYGFFVPLTGRLFPELLPKVGTTPWSGQRAALRELWPSSLPEDFTCDLSLLMHWNDLGVRLRPVVADDWVNPQRPKPGLLHQEFSTLIKHAVAHNRIDTGQRQALEKWFASVHSYMAKYRPDHDEPKEFEASLLKHSLAKLNQCTR